MNINRWYVPLAVFVICIVAGLLCDSLLIVIMAPFVCTAFMMYSATSKKKSPFQPDEITVEKIASRIDGSFFNHLTVIQSLNALIPNRDIRYVFKSPQNELHTLEVIRFDYYASEVFLVKLYKDLLFDASPDKVMYQRNFTSYTIYTDSSGVEVETTVGFVDNRDRWVINYSHETAEFLFFNTTEADTIKAALHWELQSA